MGMAPAFLHFDLHLTSSKKCYLYAFKKFHFISESWSETFFNEESEHLGVNLSQKHIWSPCASVSSAGKQGWESLYAFPGKKHREDKNEC